MKRTILDIVIITIFVLPPLLVSKIDGPMRFDTPNQVIYELIRLVATLIIVLLNDNLQYPIDDSIMEQCTGQANSFQNGKETQVSPINNSATQSKEPCESDTCASIEDASYKDDALQKGQSYDGKEIPPFENENADTQQGDSNTADEAHPKNIRYFATRDEFRSRIEYLYDQVYTEDDHTGGQEFSLAIFQKFFGDKVVGNRVVPSKLNRVVSCDLGLYENNGATLFAFGVLITSSSILQFIAWKMGVTPIMNVVPPFHALGLLCAINILFCGALCEEMVYRKLVPELFMRLILKWRDEKQYGWAASTILRDVLVIGVPALIFGFSHRYMGVLAVVNAIIAHVVLFKSYHVNNVIWCPMIAHLLYNAVMLIMCVFIG